MTTAIERFDRAKYCRISPENHRIISAKVVVYDVTPGLSAAIIEQQLLMTMQCGCRFRLRLESEVRR